MTAPRSTVVEIDSVRVPGDALLSPCDRDRIDCAAERVREYCADAMAVRDVPPDVLRHLAAIMSAATEALSVLRRQ